jgi:hypothetical protein
MTHSDTRTVTALALALALVAGAGVTGVSLIGGSSSAVAAQDATQIDSCTTIDESGTYVLTKKIENGGKTRISGTCIEITADSVTFDGGGHVIDGRGVSHTKAIAVVDSANDVTVRNVSVTEWHEGVLVEDATATVQEVDSYSNAYGVRFQNASGRAVTNSSVEENLVGIYVQSENVTLDGNDVANNEIDVKRSDGPSAMNGSSAVDSSFAVFSLLAGIVRQR